MTEARDITENLRLKQEEADYCGGTGGLKRSSDGRKSSSTGANGVEMTDSDIELQIGLQRNSLVMKMALNNEFNKALEMCARRKDRLYASLAAATLCFFRAALTLEDADIQEALRCINDSLEVSSSKRRKASTAAMMKQLLFRPDYNSYTDEEVHAELCHSESLLLLALVSFMADQSIICLVRGALRIRSGYQSHKECLYIMESRQNWSSVEARNHFESGARMDDGVFNLLISYLPPRVLRLLEYVGFSGNRSVGVDQLERSVALNDGLRSVFAALVLLTHQSYIENIFGLGHYDIDQVERLNKELSVDYPNSALFLLFLGRYHQMRGQQAEAIGAYERCIAAQDDWKQFHYLCYWEMMWCYAIQMNWDQAAHYADLLRKLSKWSAASYTYQYATFQYAKLVEDVRRGACSEQSDEHRRRLEEIGTIMQQVPGLRMRLAGKTVPAEKFAITRSIKFCQQNNRLSLPDLEYLYVGNIFVTLKNSPKLVEQLLERIHNEIDYIKRQMYSNTLQEESQQPPAGGQTTHSGVDKDDESTNDLSTNLNLRDDLNLVLLLKGMCLKYLDRWAEAEECFLEVIEHESSIEEDTFIAPHTAMELALLHLDQKRYSEARRWVKRARNDYTGYLMESIVHFRLHAADRLIKLNQKDPELYDLE